MISGSYTAAEMLVQFEVRLVDQELTPAERAAEVTSLQENLRQLSNMESVNWRYLRETSDTSSVLNAVEEEIDKLGLRYNLPGDRLRAVLKQLCQWMELRPIPIWVEIRVGETVLSTHTRRFEDLDCILAAVEYLLPPQRTFVSAAQRFARTGGEFTPAEEALLEDLRFRLELQPEDAEWYMNRALGPYRTRQQKLEHYATVLDQEISRRFPLTQESWESLQELAESLNLTPEAVAEINRDRTLQLQSKIEAERQRQEVEEERTRLQEQAQLQQNEQQRQLQQQEQNQERYRQAYRRAIQSSLTPLVFDQGRLEQARLDWQISEADAKRIAAEETAARYGSLDSDVGADYSRLRQLLYDREWQQADEETEQIILAHVSKDMQPLQPERLIALPCTDLRTIDDLWSRYSDGSFGFSAQWQIYDEQNSQTRAFLQEVGWQGTLAGIFSRPKPYSELEFNPNAPRGHLPTWRWGSRSLEGGYTVSEDLMRQFFNRLKVCLPVAKSAPAAAADVAP